MARHKHADILEAKLAAMIQCADRAGWHDTAAELRAALQLLLPPVSSADAAATKIFASAIRRAERDGLHADIAKLRAAFGKPPITWQ
jgi:hypothetical protein